MSRRHVLALLLPAALLGTALAAPPSTASTINPGSIAGRVTDLVGGPLREIRVEVLYNNSFGYPVVGQALTNARGRYRIDDIAENDYYSVRFIDPRRAYATEYYDDHPSVTGSDWVPVTRDEVTRGADAVLEPASSISGRIMDSGGQPAPDGRLRLAAAVSPYAYVYLGDYYQADGEGRFAIDRLPAATYRLEFSIPGVGTEYWIDQTSSASANTLSLGAGQHVEGLDVVIGAPDPPVVLPPPPVVNRVSPSIDGVPRVGRVLTGHAGRWTPVSVERSFQWYADGRAIRGATHQRFTVTRRQLGKRLVLLVTARAFGYSDTDAASERTHRVRRH
jgi:protocatechuate 3,4-dioxygenase beta subunit